MSHFSTLKTKLTNTEILIKSLQDLGLEVKENANVRSHTELHNNDVRADVVCCLEGPADIGWARNDQGELDLLVDMWAIQRKQNITRLINDINQKYAINRTLQQCQQTGLNNVVVKVGA